MTQTADFLVIGTGIAGLSTAIRLADHGQVLLLAKQRVDQNNTWLAQGGIAAVTDSVDSIAAHIQDTLKAGAGLCHTDVVETMVKQGPNAVQFLVDNGVAFSEDNGVYDLGREGGHSFRRILHAGDLTGAAIGNALLSKANAHPNIQILEHQLVVDLLTNRDRIRVRNRCMGAYVLDQTTGVIRPILSKLTVLATGGSGKVYLYTSNPDVATGDGVAIAYRAGCRVANMEFTQFHPTCLYHPEAKNFLISEAVRGEGGILLNSQNRRFMTASHPMAELAPRDIVARAIDAEMKRLGSDYVLLDISHKPADFITRRFPTLYKACLTFGYDMTQGPIPVVPAAHYQCGGIVTQENGTTDLEGLFAIGEVAFTGLHGANRLASNSLLEGIVGAHQASDRMIELLPTTPKPSEESVAAWQYGDAVHPDEEAIVAHNWDEVRRTMSGFVGIVRTNRRLERAARRLAMLADEVRDYYWGVIPNQNVLELRNIVQVATLIVRCAMRRRESRGLHYNLDFPQTMLEAQDTIIDPSAQYP